jgi:hypothetical protein
MKKLLVALLITGIAASAMARYGVYQLQLKGSFFESLPDKGKYIENGSVEETFPALRRVTDQLRAILIDDESLDEQFLFIPEDGVWMQVDTDLDYDIWYANQINEQYNESRYKWMEKGVVSIYMDVYLGDAYVSVNLLGNYQYSEQVNGDYSWQYALQAQGSGLGWQPVDGMEETTGIAVDRARIRYDNRRSHLMSDAYYDELGSEGGSEASAVDAAEDWLEEFLGGTSDPQLPEESL